MQHRYIITPSQLAVAVFWGVRGDILESIHAVIARVVCFCTVMPHMEELVMISWY